MKVIIFTPTVLNSAIGKVSSFLVSDLIESGNDVLVVASDEESLQNESKIKFDCDVLPWWDYESIWKYSESSDLVFYQIGDNYQYHKGCLQWIDSLNGIAIFHDNFLGHLFWAWADKTGRLEAEQILSALYSEDVKNAFFNHSSSESFINYAHPIAPLTDWIAAKSIGTICHSKFSFDAISPHCKGPSLLLQLPYCGISNHLIEDQIKSSGDKVAVLTFGNVNENKRYKSVIDAISTSDFLRNAVEFNIVGAISLEYKVLLEQYALNSGVVVKIFGRMNDLELSTIIRNADIICCLRLPALEAASASTIEAMSYGKPVLVTETGFYKDLPNECVLKVKVENEINDIAAHLESVVKNPDKYNELSRNAKKYATERFRSDVYASEMLSLVGVMKRIEILDANAKKITKIITDWGCSNQNDIINAIAQPQEIIR